MIQHLNSMYQPALLDGIKPVSKKTHEFARLENKMHAAKAMLMAADIAEKVGIDLLSGEELDRKAAELVKIDEQAQTFDRQLHTYYKREQAHQDGHIGEKMKRFFTGSPVNPSAQSQAPNQPQVVVVNQDDSLREQMKALSETVVQMSGVLAELTKEKVG